MSTSAKDAQIHHHVTMAEIQYNDGWKPRCRYCFVPCDPRSREYRALKLCTECYMFEPIIIQPKELIHAIRLNNRTDGRVESGATGDGSGEEGQ